MLGAACARGAVGESADSATKAEATPKHAKTRDRISGVYEPLRARSTTVPLPLHAPAVSARWRFLASTSRRWALVSTGEGRVVQQRRKPEIKTFESSQSDLRPSQIEPSWIIEGSPVTHMSTLTISPDGALTSGIWDCTAGKFHWKYSVDEIVHILEGEARVTDDTGTRVLVPGSVAYFPRGLQAVWEVPKYVKKIFIVREFRRPPRAISWSHGPRFVFEPRR